MIIYAAADLHLKERVWRNRADVAGDAYAAFARLVGLVRRDPGSVLLLAGDVFDSPAPAGIDELAFATGMRRLRDSGHRVLGVPGNHDTETYWRPLLFGVEELGAEPVPLGDGVTVAGVPYHRSVEALAEALANAPVCDILVMHAGFRHLLGFEEACQCEESDVPEHVRMVVNGHVHVKDVTGRVHSPGSLTVTGVDGFDEGHGAFRIDTSDWKVSWHPVKTREFVTVEWGGDPPAIPPVVRSRLPVMNLVYPREQGAEVAAFKERHENDAVFLDNVLTLGDAADNPFPGNIQGTMDVGGVIRESLARRLGDDAEAAHVAGGLLDSESPADWLEGYLKERSS